MEDAGFQNGNANGWRPESLRKDFGVAQHYGRLDGQSSAPIFPVVKMAMCRRTALVLRSFCCAFSLAECLATLFCF